MIGGLFVYCIYILRLVLVCVWIKRNVKHLAVIDNSRS